VTSVGVLALLLVPLPSWPNPLLPQHLAAALTMAQEVKLPVVMAVTPLPSPVTSVGVLASLLVPLPSWPYKL
jgi:hypothetical protein